MNRGNKINDYQIKIRYGDSDKFKNVFNKVWVDYFSKNRLYDKIFENIANSLGINVTFIFIKIRIKNIKRKAINHAVI